MKNYNIDHLIRVLKTSSDPIVLFGAGKYGKLALYALGKLGLNVKYFFDDENSSEHFEKIPILNPKKIIDTLKNPHIFICSSYAIEPILSRLERMNFSNIYNCISLYENTDYSESNFDDMNIYEISRRIELYKEECKSISKDKDHSLEIKYIDVVITEACFYEM